ncbi:putative integral membrane protein [Leishmania donovani]|uniref:Putative integral membrane protein n=1 Tax=Leishmania donovani TaxID=5661 RepID=A0A504Y4J4_LEIDO|nr:putative integral membrane protein [Leishmania donovani]
MPSPLLHREPQLISSPSSRECQCPFQGGRKLLPLADLRHQHGKGNDAGAGGTKELSSLGGRNVSTANASSAAASASGLPRLAAVAAVPPSLELFLTASSEAVETVVVCDNESTQAMHSGAAFPAAAVAPAAAAQPLKFLAVSPSTAPVSLESSSSAAASASLSCSSKPLIRSTAMPTEEGRILPLPTAATTLEEAYLESRVSYPYKGADAMATFDLANPPPAPSLHVDSADQGGSAATTTAPLLRQQESQISLSGSTPKTPPICQERLSPAAGAMKPTNVPVGPFSTTVKGVASSSAALTAHSADYGRRTNSIDGTLSREAGGAAAFERAPQQQSPSCPLRTSESFATAAATHPTTAAVPGSPSGSSKMQPSSLLSRMTTPAAATSRASAGVGKRDDSSDIDSTPPRLITSVASSLVVPLAVSETSTERTRSTPASSIGSLRVYGAPPPPFPRAPSSATRSGSPTPFSPVAVTERTGVVMDVVGYLERGYDTLWRTLARFFAAAFLPHIFLWHAVPALIPQPATSAAAEAAAPPRVHLYAVACNHPEVVLFALELLVAGVMLWSLVRYLQLSTVQRSRRHHSLYGGLHRSSTSLAARPSSAGVGQASVAAARIAAERCTAHLPTTTATPKKFVDNAESPSTSNSVRSSGHAHRIFSHSSVPLLHLPLRSFGGVRSAVAMAARAATSGSATPVRDPVTVSSCPSERGGIMRCFGGRSVSDGIVSGSTLSGRSSASSVATPSLSPYTFMGLATPAAEVMQCGFSDAHGIDTLWDVPRLQQPSRELLSGSGAGCQRGLPASPPTSMDLHASPFSVLNSAGHASLALAGLADRDGTLAKSTNGTVSIQPSVVTPAAAAVAESAMRTDSLLLSSGGAVTAALAPSSPTFGRDGFVPTMTYFGIGLGFLVCTGLAVWRLSVDYYFARYSFALSTNAALWFWLVPVCLLGIAAYVVLLIGGHTLRWRALRQLQESNARGCSKNDEDQEEAARQRAAAAALCRLRWMSWCFACVPYPNPDVALFVDLPESVIMRPDATALLPILTSRGSMVGAFAVDESDAVPPVVPRTPKKRGFCDGGDETVYDSEVSARGSALRQQSGVLKGLSKDKEGEGVFVTIDDTLEPADDILRVKREAPEPSTPVPDISGDVGSLAAATALDNFKTASLRATTSAAAADVSGSPCKPLLPPLLPHRSSSRFFPTGMVRSFLLGRSNLNSRGASSSFAPSQSLWSFGQRPQRGCAVAHVFAASRAWVEHAARELHIPDFIMRLRRSCGLAQQRRVERRSRQRTRVAAPTASVERRLRMWWSCERGSLERLVAWTYLIMLFLFSQALLSLMYFTWSWRSIAREAATATMYATDTGRAAMPVPPSFVVYGCTKWQRSLRNALWVIPPFCVSGDGSVSSPRQSTTWSMASQVALLFTLLGQRRFQVAYLYTNVALPIGFVISLCIFAHEIRLHIKSRRVLRLLALAKSRVETARKVRDAML